LTKHRKWTIFKPTLDKFGADEGAEMREVPCPCGITLTGTDDDELFRLGRAHADEHHADDGITDEYIRQHVRDNGRDVVAS
jgi:hypothetical protein